MKLQYKAIDKNSKILHGIIEAKDPQEAASYLRNKGLLPVAITKQQKSDLLEFLPFFKKTSGADLVFFTRQLSSMISSGLTLMQSLNVLKEQVQNEAMQEIIQGITTDIEDGKSFSTSLAKYPDVFSSIYVSLIRAAESSGLLDKVLERLADNLEKAQKLKGTIKGALMYPVIVVIAMIGVMMLMMIVVIPQLSILYESLNVELPITTQIVIGASKFMVNFWPVMIGLFVLSIFLYKRWYSTPSGQLIIDDLSLKLPVFGKLIQQSVLADFTRTLGLLIGTGSLVVDSLLQTADTAGNIVYKNAIIGVSKRVEKGITVGDAMSAYSLFPALVVQLAKIGEQTGKLDESLLRASDYFEREVDQSVKNLTTALEPIIMVALGIGVAFLIIAIITPIYSLSSSIK